MRSCMHGTPLPKDERYGAKEVCSICAGLPENRLVCAIMNDTYEDLTDAELLEILNSNEFDYTVKDYVRDEIVSRRSREESNNESE